MAIAKIDHIYLPKVFEERVERTIVGDETESALAVTHRDIMAVKRTWRLTLRPIPKAEVFELIEHLDAKLWGAVDFWIDYFGAEENIVKAYVEIPDDIRSLAQVGRRSMSIIVKEKIGIGG